MTNTTGGDTTGQIINVEAKVTLNELTGAAPAMALHNGILWIAWVGWKNQQLNVVGAHVKPDGTIQVDNSLKSTLNSTSDRAPALCSFNGKLWLAFRGIDNNNLNIVSSVHGNDFDHASKRTLNEISTEGPSLAVFKGKLWMAWAGTDKRVNVIGAPNGNDFQESTKQTIALKSNSRVAIGALQDHLVAVFGQSGSNSILLLRSPNGNDFPQQPSVTLPVVGGGLNCAVLNSELWITSYYHPNGFYEDADEFPLYWYVYRINGDTIVGAASIGGDKSQGNAAIAASGISRPQLAWRDTGDPSHVQVATIPLIIGH